MSEQGVKIHKISIQPGEYFSIRLKGSLEMCIIVEGWSEHIEVKGPGNCNIKKVEFTRAGVEIKES